MFYSSKLHNQRLLLVTLVFLLVLILFHNFFGFELKLILETLITLFAVYLGAFLAYTFNIERQKKVDKQKDIQNANLSLFSLLQFLNSLENYQKQIIDPERESALRLISIKPELIYEDLVPKLQIESLSFLLSGTENVNLLGRLVTEERRFHGIAFNIRKRAQLHTEQVQPAMEAAELVEISPPSVDQVRNALGDRIYTIMERATEDIILAVDQSIADIIELISDLNRACSRLFPGQEFIRLRDAEG